MIYSLFILSYLLYCGVFGDSVPTCDLQGPCLNVVTSTTDGGVNYAVCIYWNEDNAGCNKDGPISHACPSTIESDKVEGWNDWEEGNTYEMCETVACGGEAQFGIKDGEGCAFTDPTSGTIDGYVVSCEYDNGYCGGGQDDQCTWTVTAPNCGGGGEPTTPVVICDLHDYIDDGVARTEAEAETECIDRGYSGLGGLTTEDECTFLKAWMSGGQGTAWIDYNVNMDSSCYAAGQPTTGGNECYSFNSQGANNDAACGDQAYSAIICQN